MWATPAWNRQRRATISNTVEVAILGHSRIDTILYPVCFDKNKRVQKANNYILDH
jgi:hypothetical protein